jgi:tellurite resistance protein
MDVVSARPVISLNLFGIPFGLAGLTTAWAYAVKRGLAPPEVRDALSLLAGAVWLVIVTDYVRAVVVRGSRTVIQDLTDPVRGPFGSLALIVPLVLTVDGLLPHAPGPARVIIAVLIAGIVVLAGWYTGQWIYGPLSVEKLHPGYFLPTVAGGFLAAAAAGAAGYMTLGRLLFGLGMICWLILGSMILMRLFFWAALPDALTPTLAFEVAPPAVATLAYLSLHGDHIDAFAAGLGGYGRSSWHSPRLA